MSHYGVATVEGQVAAVRGDTLLLRRAHLLYADAKIPWHHLRGNAAFVPQSTDRVRRRRIDWVRTTIALAVPITLLISINDI